MTLTRERSNVIMRIGWAGYCTGQDGGVFIVKKIGHVLQPPFKPNLISSSKNIHIYICIYTVL